MRLLFLIIFLFLHNCANPLVGEKRVFICGDHPCVNQKEVDEYFNNNISIEVYTITSNKEKKENFDLVELNLLKDKLKSKNKINVVQNEKNITKQLKERKKLAKLKMKKVEENNKIIKTPKNKERANKNKATQFTFVRICKNLEECDIDKISKIIMDIGREKDYPDITN